MMRMLRKNFPYMVLVVFALASTAVYVIRPGGEEAMTLLSNVIAVGSAAFAFAAVVNVCRRRDAFARAGWIFLAVGLGLFLLGEIGWAVQEVLLGIDNPYPSIADVFWLAGYVPLFLGLLAVQRRLGISLERRETAAVVLGAAAAVAAAARWLFIPIALSPRLPPVDKVLDFAYPLADILLIVPAFSLMLLFGRSLLGRPWRLICLGLVFIGLGDLGFAYLTWHDIYWVTIDNPGNLIDLFWLAGYLSIAAGALYYNQVINDD